MRITTTTGAAALLLSLALPADAQDALGDGRGQESEVEITASRDRAGAARRLDREIRFRNAIVTGNAPGGMSFRGDVGYGAAGEFRGDLGSNDLFGFRRDSFYSGLSGQGIRGTEALQYQFSLTTGSSVPGGLLGSPILHRSGASPTAAELTRGRESGTPIPDSELVRPDRTDGEFDGSLLGTLRAASAYASTRSYQPTMLGYQRDEQGQIYGLTASSLDGIRSRVLEGFEPGERAEERADERAARQRPGLLDTRLDDRADERLDQRSGSPERIDSAADQSRTMYDVVRQRLIDEAEAAGMELEDLDQSLTELRRSLTDFRDEQSADQQQEEEQDQPQPGPTEPERTRQEGGAEGRDPIRQAPDVPGLRPDRGERDENEGDREGEGDAEPASPLARIMGNERFNQTIERLRAADNERLANLVRPGTEIGDVYTLHMRRAEEFMADGSFFDAEERFTRALAARPNDVSARVGRVHAQLGAGLYLSAAVNLRSLISDHPEVAAVRYEHDLLPSGTRGETIREQLATNVSASELTDPDRLGTESALLMAYFAYQSDNPEAIRRGLDILDNSDINADRSLVDLLRHLWLDTPEDDAGGSDQDG